MKKAFGMDAFMRANPSKQWFVPRIHRPYTAWVQARYYRFFDAYRAGRPCRVRMCSELPRGFLKSTINAGTLLWAQLEDPEFGIRLGAIDDDLAKDLFEPVKATYRGDDAYSSFNALYGSWYDPKRKWDKWEINHAYRKNTAKKEKSFMTWTVLKGFMGHHPEIASADDFVNREKLNNEGGIWLEKAQTAVTAAAHHAMPECSLFHLLGTRYHDDDPCGYFTKREGVRSWDGMPCDDPDISIEPAGMWEVYFLSARDLDTGEAIAPEIKTSEALTQDEQSNSIEFWNQMMNMPSKGDHMGLDVSQIREMYVPADKVPPGDYIGVFDTAFKDHVKQTKGDESVFLLFKRDNRPTHADYYYEWGYGSSKDRIEDFTQKVVLKLQEFQNQRKRIALLTDERSPGKSGAWFHYLKNMCNAAGVICPPTKELPRGGTKSKKKRIRVAAGFWADGRVKIVNGAPGSHKLVSQMSRFETTRRDDWADAAADLFHPDVYRTMVPFNSGEAGGARQIGPDDAELLGSSQIDNRYNENVHDSIYWGPESDPWSN